MIRQRAGHVTARNAERPDGDLRDRQRSTEVGTSDTNNKLLLLQKNEIVIQASYKHTLF